MLEGTATILVRHGYNVILVSQSKSPVGITEYRQYYREHMSEDFIVEVLEKASDKAAGIALLGVVNPLYPDKILIIIDIDDPWKWEEVLQKLPEGLRSKILNDPWAWQTGPRCPIDHEKHSIKCIKGTCTHSLEKGEHEFKLSEAKRG